MINCVCCLLNDIALEKIEKQTCIQFTLNFEAILTSRTLNDLKCFFSLWHISRTIQDLKAIHLAQHRDTEGNALRLI